MKHQYIIVNENLRLRPLEEKDIEKLRIWRNDKNNSRYLTPIEEITRRKQQAWFQRYLKNENEMIFAIDETDRLKMLTGSLAIYNFVNDQVEIGKFIIGENQAHGKGIGEKAFSMAVDFAFRILNKKKVICSVHQDNRKAYHIYSKIGFEKKGSHLFAGGGLEDELEISRKRFYNVNPGYADL